MEKRIIAIGNDHAGTDLKRRITAKFKDNFEFIDCGTNSDESVDYPDYSQKVCNLIQENKAELGILVCGTGIGMSISANKFKGIRAGLCTNSLMAKLTRQHNNANVLCLGARIIGQDLAFDCVKTFLETSFEGGRHQRRIDKLEKVNQNS